MRGFHPRSPLRSDLAGVPHPSRYEGWGSSTCAERTQALRRIAGFFLFLQDSSPYTQDAREESAMQRARRIERRSRTQERLEARVTPAQKRLIERAAALRGTSVTELVVASAQQAATNAIREFDVLHLRDEAREVFIHAVLHPPAPSDTARAAAKRYRKRVGLWVGSQSADSRSAPRLLLPPPSVSPYPEFQEVIGGDERVPSTPRRTP
jgi:uncharacterized protein (DUF1778 family)